MSTELKQAILYKTIENFIEELKDKNDDALNILIELLVDIKDNINNLSIKDLENAVSDGEDNINDFISERIQPLSSYIADLEVLIKDSTNNEKKLEEILKAYKDLNQIYIDKERDINNPNSSFFTKRRIKLLENKLSILEQKFFLEPNANKNKIEILSGNINFIRNEISQKEKFYDIQVRTEYELKMESNKKIAYKERVTNALNTLNKDSLFLKKHKIFLNTFKWIFLITALGLFTISSKFFYINITNLYSNYPYILFSELKILNYFIVSLSFIVPSIFGFIFLKQANIKSNEIYKITKRFVLIEEVIRSLNALIDISELKYLNNKVEETIDRLINNILEYTVLNEDINNSQTSTTQILELNKKLDNLVDTVEKKLNLINITKEKLYE